jgi:hypothetical protein
MDARPCFYCIVLLSALFVSSCYWQPFPTDNALASPWSENITTFSQALNTSMSDFHEPLPSVMRVVDRCWCDFSTGSVFQPFNVSQWEHASLTKLKASLERQMMTEDVKEMEPWKTENDSKWNLTVSPGARDTTTSLPLPRTSHGTPRGLLSIVRLIYGQVNTGRSVSSHPAPEFSTTESYRSKPPSFRTVLSLLRREYDLRSYGLDVIIDFGWSHS